MANKLKRIAIGLIALSMRLDAYAMQRGMTMDTAHPKDPDPKNWRTINGSKVHLTEGKIDGGAGGKFSGKDLEQDLFDNFYYPYEGYIYDHILDQDDASFWIDAKTGKIDLFGKHANDLIKKITKR